MTEIDLPPLDNLVQHIGHDGPCGLPLHPPENVVQLRPAEPEPSDPRANPNTGCTSATTCTCGRGVTPDESEEAISRSLVLIRSFLDADEETGIKVMAEADDNIATGIAYTLGFLISYLIQTSGGSLSLDDVAGILRTVADGEVQP